MRMRTTTWAAALLMVTATAGAQDASEEGAEAGQTEAADEDASQAEPEGTGEGADAEGGDEAEKKAEGGGEGQRGSMTSEYAVKVQNGIRLTIARDLDGAVAALREAIQLDPRKPQAHYFLGAAQRMKGDLETALESFETAGRMAGGDAGWVARAKAGAAMVLEQMGAERPEVPEDAPPTAPRINEPTLERARSMWGQVGQAGQQGARVVNAQVVQERQRAVQAIIELENKTVEVRKQIAEREKEKAEQEAEEEKKKKKRGRH